MAEKKPTTRGKKAARGKKPTGFTARLTSAIGPKATTMVVILVMAGGIMVAARQQQSRATEALADTRGDVVLTPEPVTKRKAAAATAATLTPSASAAPLTTSTSVTVTAKAPVTVTGCLEQHDNAFRLKDTSGADAPKSRSWKSGFLKKGSASVNVVDAKGLNLAGHVGRRVSVTGTLDGRDMSARSMRSLGSCNAN